MLMLAQSHTGVGGLTILNKGPVYPVKNNWQFQLSECNFVYPWYMYICSEFNGIQIISLSLSSW
jgi:hypothetical protein